MDKSLRGGDTLLRIVPKRHTIASRKFGAWLQLQRGARSLEQIAQRIRPMVQAVGLKVDQSLIYKIEQGRVPSWPMIGAFSKVYGVPLDETVTRLVSGLEFPGAAELLARTKTVQKETVSKSTPVADSTVPVPTETEGKHDARVGVSAADLRQLDTLSLDERVRAARTIAIQLTALLRDRPDDAGLDLRQPKRPTSRRRVS